MNLKDIRYTLDNMMKKRTSEGIGVNVKKAQVLSQFDEDLLWEFRFTRLSQTSYFAQYSCVSFGEGVCFTGR